MTHDKNREIVLSRIFNATPEQVFAAWTTKELVQQWWGPRGFTNSFRQFEVKVGGIWEYTMHGPDGTDYLNWVCFEQVIVNKKLVFQHGSSPDDPNLFQVTVTFAAEGPKTRVTMTHIFASQAERDKVVQVYHAIEGGNQTLDKMGEFVARSLYHPNLTFIQHFQVPLGTLFDCWTDPANLSRWQGILEFTQLSSQQTLNLNEETRAHTSRQESKLLPMEAQIDEVERPNHFMITAKTLGQEGVPVIEAQVDVSLSSQQELSVVEVCGQIHVTTERGQSANSKIEESFYEHLEKWVLDLAQVARTGA